VKPTLRAGQPLSLPLWFAAAAFIRDLVSEPLPVICNARFCIGAKNTLIVVCGFCATKSIVDREDVPMKKNIQLFHEKISDIGVSLEAIVGLLLSAGVIAIILRLASGKW
jgi:hypothetical protein